MSAQPASTAEISSATRVTPSTCPYRGVGCGVLIEADGARISGVRGDPRHPANHGRLCTRGATLHLAARPPAASRTAPRAPRAAPRPGLRRAPLRGHRRRTRP